MIKVLHLSHHYGCLKDHQYVCDKLGLDLTNKLSIWNDIIKRDVYRITKEIADSTWKEHKDYFNSFDFIITSDTAIAHLAGTLNVKTFLLLSFNPEWRWYIEHKYKCFYPNMNIIQQNKFGDWTGVFNELNKRLEKKNI